MQRILHLYGMMAIKERLIGNRSVKEDAAMKDYIRLAAFVKEATLETRLGLARRYGKKGYRCANCPCLVGRIMMVEERDCDSKTKAELWDTMR